VHHTTNMRIEFQVGAFVASSAFDLEQKDSRCISICAFNPRAKCEYPMTVDYQIITFWIWLQLNTTGPTTTAILKDLQVAT